MADYNSSYTGAQIDESVGVGQKIKALLGLLKANGTANPVAAAPGEDYQAPTQNLTNLDSVEGGDYIPIFDSSESGHKKVAISNLYDYAKARLNIEGVGIIQENLLDNSRFKINQRGEASYTANGYCVDRWAISGCSASINDDSFTLDVPSGTVEFFKQSLSDYAITKIRGKTVTYSVMTKENGRLDLYTLSTNIPQTGDIDSENLIVAGKAVMDIHSNSQHMPRPVLRFYNITNTAISLEIVGVKLEIGDEQTLGYIDNEGNWCLCNDYDKIRDTINCHRYFRRLLFTGGAGTVICFGANCNGSPLAYISMPISTFMPMINSTPTVICMNIGVSAPHAENQNVMGVFRVEAVLQANISSSMLNIVVRFPGNVAPGTYPSVICDNSGTAAIDISCEP